MNAFESLFSDLLEHRGYWTKTNYKVHLTKKEKRQINRPTSPAWELDILAYKAKIDKLLVVECKSYLDSNGVRLDGINGSHSKFSTRYKLFNEKNLRKVVFERLKKQLLHSDLCTQNTEINLCLAAGNIYRNKVKIEKHFDNKGWVLFDPEWIKEGLSKISKTGYKNSEAAILSKILLR